MVSVKAEKECFIIKLNEDFYPKNIIEKGIESFSEKQKISFSESNEIVMNKLKNTSEETVYEFCDYLLTLIQGEDSWH
jgi:hypothetical protein|tara:strand:- start:541 stop:774 length:234 start_codon:yes stop_codon:yes gene_type:complete